MTAPSRPVGDNACFAAAAGHAAALRLHLVRADVVVCRAPLAQPVVTSFGAMRDRPAVLVRIEDRDGAHGWGEAWCNFPACGAEHRARLLAEAVLPAALGRALASPWALHAELEARLRVLALQTGEPGPLAQALAALDIALWDLAARRAGVPLARLLRPDAPAAVPVYASGLDPDAAPGLIASSRAAGFSRFKVKVGFGRDRDLSAVAAARTALREGETLLLDANQAWDPATAAGMARALEAHAPAWLEEPLPADAPASAWAALARATTIPLAAGENLRGDTAFRAALADGAIAVIQPDACKWGGVTGCFRVASEALAAGRRYCPHYLGGGIGLLASAHLLAAAGGDGWLEVDVNPNPLREGLAQPFPVIRDGTAALPAGPGLGVAPDAGVVRRFTVLRLDLAAN
ncbi:MAG TPA: mandelate racemase/muconate lactonizing enzyme family protein [Pelomicrobium sp.]|nr:mandelate racemase/muconate lactonizing enzyme family protein [Pelomicrobium sp.]